jgi:hypothetical protein
MSAISDCRLLRRARTDPDAIGVLFRRHAPAIERFLVAETLDAAVAAELTSETFAAGLRGARGFRGGTDAEAVAWLYGIARNRSSCASSTSCPMPRWRGASPARRRLRGSAWRAPCAP